ncbi:MAG: beta-ketoacyl-[acyl-carrier-protein] synthase family protein [Bacteroidia bacterium]
MKNQRIVITGLGAITAIGDTLDETWNSLMLKKSGINQIQAFDTTGFPCKIAAEIKNFDINRIADLKQRKRLDRSAMFALSAAAEAIEASGILNSISNSARVGVFWASGNGGITTADAGSIEFGKTGKLNSFGPFFQSNVLIDSAASRISQKFGFKGPNLTIVSACSSGNSALITAQAYIQTGLCDVAIVGGSEAAISQSVVAGFSVMKALSTKNGDPENACAPFSASRNGFVIGEGAAAMILEKESDALERGALIKSYFKGGFTSNDAGHITSPDTSGAGAAYCIREALRDAEIQSHEVDAIYSHGTSTLLGDLSEYKSYVGVFKDSLRYIPVVASKSMTGHLLGASAALESVLSIEMLSRQVIIPHRFAGRMDDSMQNPPLFLPEVGVEIKLRNVLNHASGFGGQHASTVFSID